MGPEPFRIHVEQDVLDDLQVRLRRTRWTGSAHGGVWEWGTDRSYLRDLVHYWQSGFDWRAQEARLNLVPQFKARSLGIDVHFVHARGAGFRSTPLLLLHGWPDTFDRYHKVIPDLTRVDALGGPSFDVIVPSLPGFAFSSAIEPPFVQPTRQSASVLWHLMRYVLGYERFAVAGGDGGGVIAQVMAIDHPESVVGVHLTDLGWHVGDTDPSTLSRPEQRYLASSKKHFMADGGYAMVQATRPRSLAAALLDSPVGLASWIVDRFHAWSDSHGQLARSFTKDELLTNIMLYWSTRTIGSSILTYYADRRSPSIATTDRVERPVGVALFPKDGAGIPPRRLAERTLAVMRWTEMPHGGHFAALEEPALYARDVRAFFRSLGSLGAAVGQGARSGHIATTEAP